MTDDLKRLAEIIPPGSPAAEAIETARLAWNAAMSRCTEAHRAAIAYLDQSADLALRHLVELSDQSAAGETRPDLRSILTSRMEQRVLTLAEALQRHGILRILDAGAAAETINRGALDRTTNPKDSETK
jgi:phosphopantothenate synthetase